MPKIVLNYARHCEPSTSRPLASTLFSMAILLPPPPPIPWRSLSAIHRTRSFHLLSREALPQRDLHYRVGATAATAPVAAACHGAAGPLRPAAGHRKTALRSAWGAHGLFWRPRDEAAAAGGGLQGVRGGGQGEGVPPPGPQVVQAQMLPHLEYLTTVRRRAAAFSHSSWTARPLFYRNNYGMHSAVHCQFMH